MSIILFGSCGKDEINGCTDPTALNYSNVATEDDGSCILPSQSVFVEEFNLTFDQVTSEDWYTPNFNYQSGDIIIIETVNEYLEWTSLPYIFGVDVHIQGAYDDFGDVWIYLNEDDGFPYYPSVSTEVSFRVALIKADYLQFNPDLKTMSIDEIESII